MDPYAVKPMKLYWARSPYKDNPPTPFFVYECKLQWCLGVRFWPPSRWNNHKGAWGGHTRLYYDAILEPCGFMITYPRVKLPLGFLQRQVLQSLIGV